ncbi:MAG: hypothetical protein MHM6MM_002402 [Cercozoa sp. M6MM]
MHGLVFLSVLFFCLTWIRASSASGTSDPAGEAKPAVKPAAPRRKPRQLILAPALKINQTPGTPLQKVEAGTDLSQFKEFEPTLAHFDLDSYQGKLYFGGAFEALHMLQQKHTQFNNVAVVVLTSVTTSQEAGDLVSLRKQGEHSRDLYVEWPEFREAVDQSRVSSVVAHINGMLQQGDVIVVCREGRSRAPFAVMSFLRTHVYGSNAAARMSGTLINYLRLGLSFFSSTELGCVPVDEMNRRANRAELAITLAYDWLFDTMFEEDPTVIEDFDSSAESSATQNGCSPIMIGIDRSGQE